MKQKNKRNATIALMSWCLFGVWTLLVWRVDVATIGPNGSAVGMATVNQWVHQSIGVHWDLYLLTDLLSILPLMVVVGFGLLGLYQWYKRKKLTLVDKDLLALGGFYLATLAFFQGFEFVVVNYRPVLIQGILEASYPSSTTLLVLCVMPTAIMQFNTRIKNKILRLTVAFLITTFIVFMVVGRLISGVHWLSDIIGGALLSAALVTTYKIWGGLTVY